jgi:rubrerythrin
MNFNKTVLAIELDSLQKREIEMHKVYTELLGEISDKEVKSKIMFIRNQEKGHIAMVTAIISILLKYVSEG